jgi:drug/metabolite transporter (DMT)-like permease
MSTKFHNGDENSQSSPPNPTHLQKVLAAVFYGISSILVIFTNKAVMTNYKFKYFDILAAVQFLVTTVILWILILCKQIEVPQLTWPMLKEILPVTLMFLGNVLCGLGSTKSLSIPMFTALRRFSILLTMICEWYLLKTKPSVAIIVSVTLMVGGTLIASLYDLSFDLNGYSLVFLNNIFTALNGVYMKKATVTGKCSKMAVLFYNSLFSGLIMLLYFSGEHIYCLSLSHSNSTNIHLDNALLSMNLINYQQKDPLGIATVPSSPFSQALRKAKLGAGLASMAVFPTESNVTNSNNNHNPLTMSILSQVFTFPAWSDPTFFMMFLLAVSMGSILNYSIFLCTTLNSPLTTAVVGATKNVATTYIGMIAFSDYTFTWINFMGINISILGSVYYTYMILFKGAIGFGGA